METAIVTGHPDRPFVMGGLYHGEHTPPFASDGGLRTGTKTHSTTGGSADNYNELSFLDAKDAEEIKLQAERDQRLIVKNNRTTRVDHDELNSIGHDLTIEADVMMEIKVGASRVVLKPDSLTVESASILIHGNTTKLNPGNAAKAKSKGASVKPDATPVATQAKASSNKPRVISNPSYENSSSNNEKTNIDDSLKELESEDCERCVIIHCKEFAKQISSFVISDEFQDIPHLGGFMMGFAGNLTINSKVVKDAEVKGFKSELVAGGQNTDVFRHVYINAGSRLSGSLVNLLIHGPMQLKDHYDLFDEDKNKVQARAEIAGNDAGVKVGNVIRMYFYDIKSTRGEERQLLVDQLEKEIISILCA